jgi:hypothetical protein
LPTIGRERKNIVEGVCCLVQGHSFYFLRPLSRIIYAIVSFEKINVCQSSSYVLQRVSFLDFFGNKVEIYFLNTYYSGYLLLIA